MNASEFALRCICCGIVSADVTRFEVHIQNSSPNAVNYSVRETRPVDSPISKIVLASRHLHGLSEGQYHN